MQVVLYTEKSIAQSLTALNARMQAKGTSTRPALDGWVEKSGKFSVGVTSGVFGRFTRTTWLHGKLERQGSVTAIKGNVSRGATKENKFIIYGALAVVALALAGGGNLWMAAVMLPVAGALYIPLTGDYNNSEILIGELQKTLKAKATPPKTTAVKTTGAKPATIRKTTATTRPATRRPAAAKPAPALFEPENDEEESADDMLRLPLEEEP